MTPIIYTESFQGDQLLGGVITLTKRGALQIIELMESPPPKNDKFDKAMERYRKVVSNAVLAPE